MFGLRLSAECYAYCVKIVTVKVLQNNLQVQTVLTRRKEPMSTPQKLLLCLRNGPAQLHATRMSSGFLMISIHYQPYMKNISFLKVSPAMNRFHKSLWHRSTLIALMFNVSLKKCRIDQTWKIPNHNLAIPVTRNDSPLIAMHPKYPVGTVSHINVYEEILRIVKTRELF